MTNEAKKSNPFPAESLLTNTPAEGRELAVAIARHTVKTIQPNMDVLHEGRDKYANDPDPLTAAAQVVAIEFQTIAKANNYWRN